MTPVKYKQSLGQSHIVQLPGSYACLGHSGVVVTHSLLTSQVQTLDPMWESW